MEVEMATSKIPQDNQTLDSPLLEAAAAARYIVDAAGSTTDVILPMPVWEKLLSWLEDREDSEIVRQWLPRLKMGPEKAGAIPWDEVEK
jgi:hypothetical protein